MHIASTDDGSNSMYFIRICLFPQFTLNIHIVPIRIISLPPVSREEVHEDGFTV